MAFPLTAGGVAVADPEALAALVREEAGLGAPRRLPARPSAWVAALVQEGALEERLATALAAALLRHPEPGTVCEGARLAALLGSPVLGPVALQALRELDPALLLQVDPGEPGRSVEEALLGAAASLSDLTDPELRRPLLGLLRDAGLEELEDRILADHGDAEDLRACDPALVSPLSAALRDRLVARLAEVGPRLAGFPARRAVGDRSGRDG